MKKIEIITPLIEYDSIKELSTEDQNLIIKAQEAVKNAYAPYSKFHVSAAVLLENNEIITGTNQENAAYPSGLCAERVAVFYANSKYPNVAIKTIAVTIFANHDFVDNPGSPCGACRQVLIESENRFKKPIKVILAGKKKIQVLESVKSLMPLHFDEHLLEIK